MGSMPVCQVCLPVIKQIPLSVVGGVTIINPEIQIELLSDVKISPLGRSDTELLPFILLVTAVACPLPPLPTRPYLTNINSCLHLKCKDYHYHIGYINNNLAQTWLAAWLSTQHRNRFINY